MQNTFHTSLTSSEEDELWEQSMPNGRQLDGLGQSDQIGWGNTIYLFKVVGQQHSMRSLKQCLKMSTDLTRTWQSCKYTRILCLTIINVPGSIDE